MTTYGFFNDTPHSLEWARLLYQHCARAMPAHPDYQPVACGFYDELGLRMMRGTSCRLVVESPDGQQTVETTIEDLYTDGDAEYVRLEEGRTIRLDRIVRVDDVERDAC